MVEALQLADAGVDSTSVPYGLDDVSSSRLAFGADHRGAFGNAPQRLAKVATPADEGDLEQVLVDVVLLVGRRQHLGLIDVVDAKRLEDLRLDEMSDAALRHHRNRHRFHDRADQGGV